MDLDTIGYAQDHYDEIANEIKNMVVQISWKKNFIAQKHVCAPDPQ